MTGRTGERRLGDRSVGRMTFGRHGVVGRHGMDSWATKLLTDGKPVIIVGQTLAGIPALGAHVDK